MFPDTFVAGAAHPDRYVALVMPKQLLIAFLMLVGAIPTAASATSCAPITERYFVTCASAHCKTTFRVTQVDAFGMCGRRDRVEEPDSALSEFVVTLLDVAENPKVDGTYVLAFRFHHWRHAKEPTFDAFQRNVLYELSPSKDREKNLKEIPATTVVEMLQRHIGPDWITRETSAVGDLHATAQRDALSQAWRNAGLWFAFWASFLALLVALVHSIHQFFRRVHSEGSKGLLRPLLIQLVVTVCASLGVAFPMVMQFWPGLLLLPAIVVVWLAEGWSYYRARNAT